MDGRFVLSVLSFRLSRCVWDDSSDVWKADACMFHVFESFWRGANAGEQKGSGLGLYIARQLMLKMGGEIFAEIVDGEMCVTAVFVKA